MSEQKNGLNRYRKIPNCSIPLALVFFPARTPRILTSLTFVLDIYICIVLQPVTPSYTGKRIFKNYTTYLQYFYKHNIPDFCWQKRLRKIIPVKKAKVKNSNKSVVLALRSFLLLYLCIYYVQYLYIRHILPKKVPYLLLARPRDTHSIFKDFKGTVRRELRQGFIYANCSIMFHMCFSGS